MKKWISGVLCLCLILSVTGCGNSSSGGKAGSNQPVGVNDVLEQRMAEADGSAQSQQAAAPQQTQSPQPDTEAIPANGVDVDLTALSGTMVYSEVYNMITAPEDYLGKTVKMDGRFAYYRDEATGKEYFACIIQDATACCAQGIEFVLAGDCVYPDDYPALDAEICVAGVFDTYAEGDITYCTLRNAAFVE